MYNWSTDTSELQKNPEQYTIWKLEQLINYGLNDEKINKRELKKYWTSLNIFDPARKKYISLLIDEKTNTNNATN